MGEEKDTEFEAMLKESQEQIQTLLKDQESL